MSVFIATFKKLKKSTSVLAVGMLGMLGMVPVAYAHAGTDNDVNAGYTDETLNRFPRTTESHTQVFGYAKWERLGVLGDASRLTMQEIRYLESQVMTDEINAEICKIAATINGKVIIFTNRIDCGYRAAKNEFINYENRFIGNGFLSLPKDLAHITDIDALERALNDHPGLRMRASIHDMRLASDWAKAREFVYSKFTENGKKRDQTIMVAHLPGVDAPDQSSKFSKYSNTLPVAVAGSAHRSVMQAPVQITAANNNKLQAVTKTLPAKTAPVTEKPLIVDLAKMMPAVPADLPVQVAEFGQDNPAVKKENLKELQMAFAEIADAQAAEQEAVQQNIAAAKAKQKKADEFEQKFSLKGMIASLFNIRNFAKDSVEQGQTAFVPEPEKPQPLPTDIPGNKVATVVAIAVAASSAAVPPRGNGNLSMKFKEVAEVTRTVAGKVERFHRITTYDDQMFHISQTMLTADRNLAYRIKIVDGKEMYQLVDLNETVLAKLQQSMARKVKEAGAPKVA